MKKYLLFLLGLVLLLPFKVFAMHDYHYSMQYEAIVTNPNGAVAYYNGEELEPVPYNTKLFILEEEYDSDSKYYACYDDGCVSPEDIKPVEDTYDSEYYKSQVEDEDDIDALALKNVVIRKGPADSFESTGITIKKGETITVKKYIAIIDHNTGDPDDEDSFQSYDTLTDWAFVDYNGTEGFIKTYGSVAFVNKYITAYTINNTIKLSSGTKVAASTMFKNEIYSLQFSNKKQYTLYKNELLTIPYKSFVSKDETIKVTTLKDIKVYDESSNTSGNRKVVATIKKGETFETSYYEEAWFSGGTYEGKYCYVYYEKGNVKGWIEVASEGKACFNNYKESTNVGKIKSVMKYCVVGKTNCVEETKPEPTVQEETPVETPQEETPEVIAPTPEDAKEEEKISTRNLIIYCVLGALTLINIILIVVLIKMKKKGTV